MVLPKVVGKLANAIKHHQIHPYYQPLISARNNTISGAEILACWNHEELGFIPPDVFFQWRKVRG